MKKIGCFLLFVLVAAAAPLSADSDLTLFGAAQSQGKLNIKTGTAAASSLTTFDPGTFGTFGIRLGHGNVMGGEHTFSYTPKFVSGGAKAFMHNSNFLVQAPLPKVKPYATAGFGSIYTWGSDDLGRPALGKIGWKLALNYGGGVKVLPAGPVGLRFDIRGYLIPDAKFNVPSPTATDPIATVKSLGQTLNMFEAGFGIVFSFKR